MPKFRFAKLVRDNIVDQQLAAGAKPTYHTLEPEEHKRELVKKIVEEAQEIDHNDVETVADEIADVQQALDDLKALHSLNDDDIAKAQAAKNAKNGAFKKGLYVESIEVDENDTWADYYRQHPDRYPEIK
jgi:predicted house-cleaning noncanonical NTP pyrophosphatase (MazG superfamily)